MFNQIAYVFNKFVEFIDKKGVKSGFYILMFLLTIFLVKIIISYDMPKILDQYYDAKKIESMKERELREENQNIRFRNIQSYLDRVILKDSICQHASIAMFHDQVKSLDEQFDFKYSMIILEQTINGNRSSNILPEQPTSLMPYYIWLRDNRTFEGNLEQLNKIDKDLASREKSIGVKYLYMEMVQTKAYDDKLCPVAIISFCWETEPNEEQKSEIYYYTNLIKKQLITTNIEDLEN